MARNRNRNRNRNRFRAAGKGETLLSLLRPGQTGTVYRLETKDGRRLNKLMALGFFPGMPLRVVQVYPAFVVYVGNTQVAIDQGIAAGIIVMTDS